MAAGAAGIAVMGEVMRAADPETTVRALVEAITAA
jgi:thiamine monophosphate synthase